MEPGPYLALLTRLERERVAYAIAGGFAVVLHGVPRMTFDLDLVVELTDPNVSRLVAVLSSEGYRPRLPVALAELTDANKRREWTEERNLIAFSLFHPQRVMEEVDVLLRLPFPWQEIAADLERMPLGGDEVAVVGRKTLRRMKLATGRDKDRADAELLGGDDV